MSKRRDEFDKPTIDALSKRASYICSNPDCKKNTIAPAVKDETKVTYIGRAAHITAASEGGPRYDQEISSEERRSIDNGIFLCSNCADMIDKNNGDDYPVEVIRRWKVDHDMWVRNNLNRGNLTENKGRVINVTSHDQKGGITAGVVNLGSRERKVTGVLESQLIEYFPNKEEPIKIKCMLGNAESISFAEQIQEFLISQGYQIDSLLQVIQKERNSGQFVDPVKRIITIGFI